MRQVLYDTITLVRGLVDPRAPYPTLFNLPPDWKVCISDAILREVFDTLLSAPSLGKQLPSLAKVTAVEAYRRLGPQDVFPLPGEIEIEICTDPADNKFLASALAMDCDILVTGIPELLELQGNSEWRDFKAANSVRVEVMDAASFVALVRGGGS